MGRCDWGRYEILDDADGLLFRWDNALFDPLHKRLAGNTSCSQIKHDPFLFVDRRMKFITIQYEECFHRGMPYSLVAIDERMVEHQRKAKGCCFAGDIGIKVLTTEALTGLGKSGFQNTEVPNSARTTPTFDDGPVEFKNFGKRKIAGHERRR